MERTEIATGLNDMLNERSHILHSLLMWSSDIYPCNMCHQKCCELLQGHIAASGTVPPTHPLPCMYCTDGDNRSLPCPEV